VAATFYVDGLSLYYGSLRGTPYRWLDLRAVATGLKLEPGITRIHYFATLDPDAARAGTQQTYLRALRAIGVRVHDVVGTHAVAELSQRLLEDDRRGRHELAAILSNDGRLVEPISRVACKTCIVTPYRRKLVNRALIEVTTFPKHLSRSILETSLLPESLTDAAGPFAKPARW
jgi:hypothetical protein